MTRSAFPRSARPRRERVPAGPSTSHHPRSGLRRRRIAVVALALPPVLALAACTGAEAEPLTVKVTRASVTSSVTATGSLQAITEQNLGFPHAGKLVELNVAVGQQVAPGQVLGRIDDFGPRQELASTRAQLAQEQAALSRIRDGNQVGAAKDDLGRAGKVLDATKKQAEAVDEANAAAVEQAEDQLKLDKEILDSTEDRTSEDRESCDEDRDHRDSDSEDEDRDRDDDSRVVRTSDRSDDCRREAEVEDAERDVRASKSALDQAEHTRNVEHTEQQLAIENARRDLAAAKNEAEGARSDRPHDIDEQAAIVTQLQVEVDTTQRDVDDTVLRAPVAGKVASINGVVGEFLAGGSGTTPLAPGGGVALPEANAAVSSGDDLGGEGDAPGGSSFLVLNDVHTFQVVAPFAETDAARIQPNQQVQVTFDAVPELARAGTVASIAPTGTDIQGVMSYYVVIVLNELDPRLMDGQTAAAHVVVDQLDKVLVVPNAAIQQSGQSGVVSVLERDGSQRQVQVELGVSGDSVTQVVSGLEEGQQVIVAQAE